MDTNPVVAMLVGALICYLVIYRKKVKGFLRGVVDKIKGR